MVGVKKIEDRTHWFIDAYKKLEGEFRLPSNKDLAGIMGIKSKSTVTNILNLQQNIQPEQWKKFKDHFKINDPPPSSQNSEREPKQKTGQPNDRADLADAMATIRGYNLWLQGMLETSLGKILQDQIGSSALIGELLRRDFRKEASGNEDVLKKIVGEFLQRIGPKLSSSVREDIVSGDGK